MLKNWYIAIFAILLAGAGMGFVPFSVPNQEIVVQFSQEISINDAEAAIANVRAQLAQLGVEDVQVVERADGSLKISYYSDIDVSFIQEAFAQQQVSSFNNTTNDSSELPFKDIVDVYQFTVSEIGADADTYNGLKGHLLEIETKSHRFYPPEFFFGGDLISTKKESKRIELSVRIYSQQLVVVAVISRLLPETRAGPLV